MEYLTLLHWPEGCARLRCGGKDVSEIRNGYWRCQECRYWGSVIFGTLFQDTHKPLRLWFLAMDVVNQRNGVSALGRLEGLGFGSFHTAWESLHRLRQAVVRSGRDPLRGIAEMDETFVGGARSGKRRPAAEGKTLVLVAAERTEKGIGRIWFATGADSSGEKLKEATLQVEEPGSAKRTDGWESYTLLPRYGHSDVPINHKNTGSRNVRSATRLVASLLKRWPLAIQ